MVVVGKADDIVFTEIDSALDLDDDEWGSAGIVQAVLGSCRDQEDSAGSDLNGSLTNHRFPGTRNGNPVLAAPPVELEAEALARLDLNALDLKPSSLAEHTPITPRGPTGASR